MAVELAPAIVGAAGAIVTAWLRHRGRLVRLEAERDAALDDVRRLERRVDALEKLLFGRVNIDTPVAGLDEVQKPDSPGG